MFEAEAQALFLTLLHPPESPEVKAETPAGSDRLQPKNTAEAFREILLDEPVVEVAATFQELLETALSPPPSPSMAGAVVAAAADDATMSCSPDTPASPVQAFRLLLETPILEQAPG